MTADGAEIITESTDGPPRRDAPDHPDPLCAVETTLRGRPVVVYAASEPVGAHAMDVDGDRVGDGELFWAGQDAALDLRRWE